MSYRAQRRQAKTSVTVKQAFEENENKNENKSNSRHISDEYQSLPNGSNIDINKFFERALFTINDSTMEVILANSILSWSRWSNVSNEISYEDIHQKQTTNNDSLNSIDLHNVYGISPIYHGVPRSVNVYENLSDISVSNTSSSSISSNTPLRGFQLHSYDKMNDNISQEVLIIFQSDSSTQIEKWYRLLSKILILNRPSRNILVLCNPYAGSGDSRYVYSTKVKPMLDQAHHSLTYFEIDDINSADQVVSDFHNDFDSLDGIVIIGGDGSVINVINALIRYVAKQNRTRLDTENDLPQIPVPICIVPNANFSAGAGYPATVLKYFTRYSLRNPKKTIRKSFSKAASNKNLRSIEMEIRYIPADQNSITMTHCHRDCNLCFPASIEEMNNQVTVFDNAHMKNINKRKVPYSSNTSITSSNSKTNIRLLSASLKKSYNEENEETQQWKTLQGNYLQVAVLTNANLWSFAPRGLSKFGHLADGLLDLVLIGSTTRKEFLRYITRNGNSKNQFDLSFTKIIKVKEIELELKFPNNYIINEISNTSHELDSLSPSDDSSNEEYDKNESKGSLKQQHEPHPPNIPISDDSRRHRRRHHHMNEQIQEHPKQTTYAETEYDNIQNDSYNSNVSTSRKSIFHSLKLKKDKTFLSRPSSFDVGKIDDDKQSRKSQRAPQETLRPAKSLLNLLTRSNSSSGKLNRSLNLTQDSTRLTNKSDNVRKSLMMSRSSSKENEQRSTFTNENYRNKKQPCMWNLNFTPYNSPLLRIKCFYRFLSVFGVGLNSDSTMKEINYSCFGRII